MGAIVFLCTGNICRSPVAEVIAIEMYTELGLRFCSAGLDALEGCVAMAQSRDYVAHLGLSLAEHRAQPVTQELLVGAKWVIGMTRSHAALFRSRYGGTYAGSIGILGAPGVDMAHQMHSPAVEEVADPYGMSPLAYQGCGDQIGRLLVAWRPVFESLNNSGVAQEDHS